MRAAWLAALFFAPTAWADQAIPQTVVGKGDAAWAGQCAARLQKARDQIAKKAPRFKAATVQAVAREDGVAGDPTSHRTRDENEDLKMNECCAALRWYPATQMDLPIVKHPSRPSRRELSSAAG